MDSQQLSVIMAESRKKEIIQRERQISLINEEIDKKRRLKSEDKKIWVAGIIGAIMSCALINFIYEIATSNRIDNVTRAFGLSGVIGVALLIWSLYKEREEEKYINMLEQEVKEEEYKLKILIAESQRNAR